MPIFDMRDWSFLQIGQRMEVADEAPWPEGPHWGLRDGCHELLLAYRSPSPTEIVCINRAPAEFGLHWDPPLMLLTYRFGVLPWSDTPFDWHRIKGRPEPLPELFKDPRERIILRVILVDTATSIVVGLRLVSWSPAFSLNVIRNIRQQAELPADSTFEAMRAQLYERAGPKDIAQRCVVMCRGGE